MGRRADCVSTILVAVLAFVFLWGQAFAGTSPVYINELLIGRDKPGRKMQYVELYGSKPSTALTGMSLVFIDCTSRRAGGVPGKVLNRIDFPKGAVLNAQGFYVIADSVATATYSLKPDMKLSETLPYDSQTVILAATWQCPAVGKVVDGTENIYIYDKVALINNETWEPTFYHTEPLRALTYEPLHGIYRRQDGVSTDSVKDFGELRVYGSKCTPGKPNASVSTVKDPDAKSAGELLGPRIPPLKAGALTWDRDPQWTFVRSREQARPFLIYFGSSKVPASLEIVRGLANSTDFQLEVSGRKLNLVYMDVGADPWAQEWTKRLQVAKVPTLILYDPTGKEVGRSVDVPNEKFVEGTVRLIQAKVQF